MTCKSRGQSDFLWAPVNLDDSFWVFTIRTCCTFAQFLFCLLFIFCITSTATQHCAIETLCLPCVFTHSRGAAAAQLNNQQNVSTLVCSIVSACCELFWCLSHTSSQGELSAELSNRFLSSVCGKIQTESFALWWCWWDCHNASC